MAETLTNQVGAYLGIGTPSTGTLPTLSQINEWLKRGAIFLARVLPVDELSEIVKNATVTISGGFGDLPADFMRMVVMMDVSDSDKVIPLVTPSLGKYIDSEQNSMISGVVCWITNNDLYTTATGNIDINYIPEPADTSEIPSKFHQLAIKYAVIQAKIEAQELDEVAVLQNELIASLRGV